MPPLQLGHKLCTMCMEAFRFKEGALKTLLYTPLFQNAYFSHHNFVGICVRGPFAVSCLGIVLKP